MEEDLKCKFCIDLFTFANMSDEDKDLADKTFDKSFEEKPELLFYVVHLTNGKLGLFSNKLINEKVGKMYCLSIINEEKNSDLMCDKWDEL